MQKPDYYTYPNHYGVMEPLIKKARAYACFSSPAFEQAWSKVIDAVERADFSTAFEAASKALALGPAIAMTPGEWAFSNFMFDLGNLAKEQNAGTLRVIWVNA